MRLCSDLIRAALVVLGLAALVTACGDDDGAVCNNDGVCDVAAGETNLTCPGDCPVCNHDGTCDTAFGENETNCPADCPEDPCNHDGVCGAGENTVNCPDDCPLCDHDGVCDAASGETTANCPDDCPVCNDDGVCDAGEDFTNCPDDCPMVCAPSAFTGARHDFVVSEIAVPTSSMEAHENGVDLDGDGEIDNKLGSILTLFAQIGVTADINLDLNQRIAAGEVLLLGRLHESGNADGVISLQTLQGTPTMSPPAFDGSDNLTIDPSNPLDLLTCGTWIAPQLTTDASRLHLLIPVPMFGPTFVAYGWYDLHNARVQTVADPNNPFYATSAATATTWTDVMVGGGLTQDQILNDILPAMVVAVNDLIALGGADADTVVVLFDGNCVVLADVPACQSVVAGVGACDDTANPPVITLTELQCNALLHSAFAPDVDSDGDGENDLVSFGYRIVSAVPATLN
jgi:hypothetical protein